MKHSDLIIVGSGMAGYTVLREVRKLDKDMSITLICADGGDFYSKPMLSNALAQNKTPQSLVTQAAAAMVEGQQFTLLPHTRVTSIDPHNHQLTAADEQWSYGKLLLATGANPIRLAMDGDAADDAISVNHLDDYRDFHQRLDAANSIAIIGPGLIGCEFANDLATQDKSIHVIGPDAWPISTLLPEVAGEFLRARLEHQGIRFHLQDSVTAIDHLDGGYRLQLQTGTALDADLVLSAVGLRPNTALAAEAGVEVKRGIVCDRLLQTSAEDVYALGDCAEINGFNLPFVLPIMHGARALAKTLTGTPSEVVYPAMPVAIKTPACPLVVASPVQQDYTTEVEQTENGVKVLYRKDDTIVGFVLAGDASNEKQTLARAVPGLFG